MSRWCAVACDAACAQLLAAGTRLFLSHPVTAIERLAFSKCAGIDDFWLLRHDRQSVGIGHISYLIRSAEAKGCGSSSSGRLPTANFLIALLDVLSDIASDIVRNIETYLLAIQ